MNDETTSPCQEPLMPICGAANTCSSEEKDCDGFSFSEALQELKAGGAISRYGWHKKGMYLKLQVPDTYSKMTEPYIYLVIPKNGMAAVVDASYTRRDGATRIPWLASQADLLTHDWHFVSPM